MPRPVSYALVASAFLLQSILAAPQNVGPTPTSSAGATSTPTSWTDGTGQNISDAFKDPKGWWPRQSQATQAGIIIVGVLVASIPLYVWGFWLCGFEIHRKFRFSGDIVTCLHCCRRKRKSDMDKQQMHGIRNRRLCCCCLPTRQSETVFDDDVSYGTRDRV